MSTVVTPNPAPTQVVTVAPNRLGLVLQALIVLGLGILIYWHVTEPKPAPGPVPDARVDGVATGKAYAPLLLDALATGFEESASKLEKGGTMDETAATAADSFKTHRLDGFNKVVTPALSKVIKPGTEPRDDEHRAEVVKFERDFAKGLRGGK